MENQTCFKCKCQNPEHLYRFAAVHVNSTSSSYSKGAKTYTTTTTTEKFEGVDRAWFCDKCIKAKRIGDALLGLIIGLVAGFVVPIMFLAFFSDKDKFNNNAGKIALGCLVFGAIVAVISFLVNFAAKKPKIASKMMGKLKAKETPGVLYVPVDRAMYTVKNATQPDIQTFQRESGLKTNVAIMVYTAFIANVQGEELVDQMMLLPKPENGEVVIPDLKEKK